MAVAYASSDGTAATGLDGASLVVNKPSGTVQDNLLLALATTGSGNITAPAGWSTIVNLTTVRLFAKVAGASEPSTYTFTRSVTATGSSVTIARITGADPTTPIDVGSGIAIGTANTVVIPSLTASTGTYLFMMVAAHTGGGTFTPPGGTTEDYDQGRGTPNYGTAGGHQTIAAGATGTRTWNISINSLRGGAMVAIIPAANVPSTGAATGSWSAVGSASGTAQHRGSGTGVHSWSAFATSGDGPPDSVTMAQVRAAIANRNSERVNIGIFGASVVEGYPAPIDLWIETQLAQKLRAKYNTTGLGSDGGYGYIGIPTFGLENTATTPVGYMQGTFNESMGWGGHHRVWVATTLQTSPGLKLTLPDDASSVVIETVGGATGHAVGGRYRINGGSWVTFNTFAASAQSIDVTVPGPLSAGDVIEIAHNTSGSGNVVVSGFRVYNGDEGKGIQVHNHGHYGYRIQDWNVARSAADPGWLSTMLDYDLIIFSDWGGNDGSGPGNLSAAEFYTAFSELITWMRTTGGYTGDILIASLYKIDRDFVDPWEDYVEAQKIIALEQQVAFLQLDQYMPEPPNAIYAPDNIHGNADGSAYDIMSDLFYSRIVPQEGTATGSWSASGTATGEKESTGSVTGSWTVSGTSSGETARSGSSTGSWSASGSATGRTVRSGGATGSWSASGTADGEAEHQGTCTGSWSVSGGANGQRVSQGAASTDWTVDGTGFGFSGGAGLGIGSWTVTGEASGERESRGSKVTTWNVNGTASGITSRSGSAGGSWDVSGSSTGGALAEGSASGSWSASGEASGAAAYRGRAASSWTADGTATGEAIHHGQTTRSWSVDGSASGARESLGDAVIPWSVSGSAIGAKGQNSGGAEGSYEFHGIAFGTQETEHDIELTVTVLPAAFTTGVVTTPTLQTEVEPT